MSASSTSYSGPSDDRSEVRLLDFEGAAHYLGISTWSVRALVDSGELPRVTLGRSVRFDIHDLEALVARNKQVRDGWT